MKNPHEDLNDNIPYLDRSVITDSALSESQAFFRKNGYLVLKEKIDPVIIDAVKKDKKLFPDICKHQLILSLTRDLIGDDMVSRTNTYGAPEPEKFNYWCINAFVALEANHNLEVQTKSHKAFVGVTGDDKTPMFIKWDCQKVT